MKLTPDLADMESSGVSVLSEVLLGHPKGLGGRREASRAMREDRFTRLLNGNPAMQMIWEEALERVHRHEPLAPVQRIVMQEWLERAIMEEIKLTALSQKNFISNEKMADLAALRTQISLIRESLERESDD